MWHYFLFSYEQHILCIPTSECKWRIKKEKRTPSCVCVCIQFKTIRFNGESCEIKKTAAGWLYVPNLIQLRCLALLFFVYGSYYYLSCDPIKIVYILRWQTILIFCCELFVCACVFVCEPIIRKTHVYSHPYTLHIHRNT